MTKHQTVSTHKIILFLVFIMAAILSSLFVFRMSHTQDNAILSDDSGTFFSVPRDIKEFDLIKADGASFSNKDLINHWSLLFFGFTHCPNICPTTMTMLSTAYPELQKTYPNLQVVLISLDPERDTMKILTKYTKAFHADFMGVSGKIENLRKLQSQLGIYSESDGKELQHTSSIILINPQGKWAGIFKYGLTPAKFVNSFEHNISKLS